MADLLPCPFCGDHGVEEAQSAVPTMQGGFKRAVYCNSCFSEGPTADSSEQAIALWNFRPHVAVQEERDALNFLCGLHPEVTVDGPPMVVAERIFDAVLAERASLNKRIKDMERNLEWMRRAMKGDQP